DELRAHAPAQVLVSGGITNFSLPGEFARGAEWLDSLAPSGAVHIVPGNHDALVPVEDAEGMGRLRAFTEGGTWPWVKQRGAVSFIGLSSALPTATLVASGRLGAAQLTQLEQRLL